MCCWVTTGGRDPPRGQTVNHGLVLVSTTDLVTGLGVSGLCPCWLSGVLSTLLPQASVHAGSPVCMIPEPCSLC